MPVVSRSIEFSVQANGSLNVVERHLRHDGEEFTIVYTAPAGTDLEAAADAHALIVPEPEPASEGPTDG